MINATRETLFQSQNTHTFSSFYLVPLRIATEDHLPPSYSIHIYPHVSHQTSAGPPSLHLWSQSFPPARLLLFRPTVTKSFFSISIIPSICMSKQSQTSLSNFVSKTAQSDLKSASFPTEAFSALPPPARSPVFLSSTFTLVLGL